MSGRPTEATDGPVMLWALDEVANIAPIHDLPALVSQAGGQRLQVMVGLQDLSQARSRWGAEAAEGFMSLFQTKVVLSGIGDSRTLEGISLALGEYDRKVVSSSKGTSESDEWFSPQPLQRIGQLPDPEAADSHAGGDCEAAAWAGALAAGDGLGADRVDRGGLRGSRGGGWWRGGFASLRA